MNVDLVRVDLEQVAQQLLGGLAAALPGLLIGLLGKREVRFGNINNLLTLAQQQVQQYLPQIEATVSQFVNQAQTALNTFNSVANSFLSSLNKPQARSALLLASQQAKGDIADAFNTLLNEALGHVTSIATSLANVGLASILGALQGNGKRGIFDGLTDILGGLTSTLSGHIDNITGSLTSLGSNLVGAVTPHLQDLQDQLTNHALNAAQSLLGTLAGISGTLQG